MDAAFKRINFFKGFSATAEDWQAAERYHSEKRRLHNKYFHPSGVIVECLNGLAVTATQGGSVLHVEPGMAVDGEGRELYVPQPVDLTLNVQDFRSKTIYVVIVYKDEPIDFRANALSPDYAGHAFIEELPTVTITTDLPDNNTKLELARVKLSSDATAITNPKNPSRPAENEVNTTYVKKARGARVRLEDMAEVVKEGDVGVSGRPTTGGADPGMPVTIPIESVTPSREQRCYVASVSLVELKSDRSLLDQVKQPHGLSWQIQAQWTKDNKINYQLQLFNSSPVDVLVMYKVYRFI
jgi:hypothetical protein